MFFFGFSNVFFLVFQASVFDFFGFFGFSNGFLVFQCLHPLQYKGIPFVAECTRIPFVAKYRGITFAAKLKKDFLSQYSSSELKAKSTSTVAFRGRLDGFLLTR